VLVIFCALQFICVMLAVGAVIWQDKKYDNKGFDLYFGKQEQTGFVLWISRYATWLCVFF
jgi:hypothetical protein